MRTSQFQLLPPIKYTFIDNSYSHLEIVLDVDLSSAFLQRVVPNLLFFFIGDIVDPDLFPGENHFDGVQSCASLVVLFFFAHFDKSPNQTVYVLVVVVFFIDITYKNY